MPYLRTLTFSTGLFSGSVAADLNGVTLAVGLCTSDGGARWTDSVGNPWVSLTTASSQVLNYCAIPKPGITNITINNESAMCVVEFTDILGGTVQHAAAANSTPGPLSCVGEVIAIAVSNVLNDTVNEDFIVARTASGISTSFTVAYRYASLSTLQPTWANATFSSLTMFPIATSSTFSVRDPSQLKQSIPGVC